MGLFDYFERRKLRQQLLDETFAGYTELTRALAFSDKTKACRLINAGADVNEKNSYGYTPLMYASERGYTEIAALLLTRGTDVNARSDIGYTALINANGAETVSLLLENGANVNAQVNNSGYTALTRACELGDAAVVTLLLAKGADVGARSDSHTALMYASGLDNEGFPDIVSLLLQNGAAANIDAQNKKGYTALMLASLRGRGEIVSLLLQNGANTSLTNGLGKRAADLTSNPIIVDVLNNYALKHEGEKNMGIFGKNPYQNANASNQPPQTQNSGGDYAAGEDNYGDVAPMGFIAISEQHVACVFILDTSGSMNRNGAIHKLNEGLSALKAHFDEEGERAACVDVAVISCGPDVKVMQNFTPMTKWSPPVMKADGQTPMGQALIQAMDMINEQKNRYKSLGTPYYRPWIVCITDGEPTDPDIFNSAASSLKAMENSSGVVGYCIGVEGFNEINMAIAFDKGEGRLLKLANADFKILFKFLGNSMSALRDSGPTGKTEATVEMPRQMTFVQ
jgi:uncharacterized protein YegL/ankyrin repeat protein